MPTRRRDPSVFISSLRSWGCGSCESGLTCQVTATMKWGWRFLNIVWTECVYIRVEHGPCLWRTTKGGAVPAPPSSGRRPQSLRRDEVGPLQTLFCVPVLATRGVWFPPCLSCPRHVPERRPVLWRGFLWRCFLYGHQPIHQPAATALRGPCRCA